MSVINLHGLLSNELVEAWRATEGSGFHPVEIRKAISSLLNREKRFNLIRRATHLIATLMAAGLRDSPVRLEGLIFATPPSERVLQDFLISAGDAGVGGLSIAAGKVVLPLDGSLAFATELAPTTLRRLLLIINATAEFLGHARFSQFRESIRAANRTPDALSLAAKALSDDLRTYFRTTGGGQHGHDKQRLMRAYIADRRGDERYSGTDVISEYVLDFWRTHCQDDSWMLYATTHAAFVDYARELDVQLTRTSWVSEEAAGHLGEWDDDRAGGVDGMAHSREARWAELRDQESGPKYIKETQRDAIRLLADLPAAHSALLASAVRATRFRRVENTLARNSRGKTLEELLATTPDGPSLCNDLYGIARNLEEACWASVHILTQARRVYAMEMLEQIAESDAFAAAFAPISREAKRARNAGEPIADLLLAHFAVSEHPPCIALRRQAKAGFDKTGRSGFRAQDVNDADNLDQLELCWPAALGTLQHLQSRQKILASTCQSMDDRRDLRTFEMTYRQIFGLGPHSEDHTS